MSMNLLNLLGLIYKWFINMWVVAVIIGLDIHFSAMPHQAII